MDDFCLWLKERITSSPMRWMSLAEWMEAVLYHPRWGYYMQDKKKIGKDGDYYTSSSFHPLFGQLLAEIFCGLLGTLPQDRWNIVELGGGDGRLAAAVLDAFQTRTDIYEKLTYYVVEKSPYHRKLQQDMLARNGRRVVFMDRVESLCPFSGVIFSNEFFDAMPVHSLVAQEGIWQEVGVTWDEAAGRFIEKRIPCENVLLLNLLDEWGWQPTREARVKISLDAVSWLQTLAGLMDSGYVLSIDYGYLSDGTCRPDGTVRGYRAHRLIGDVFSYPGGQDVTADVNFALLMREGKKVGLEPQWVGTQRDFLLKLGILEELSDGAGDPLSPQARKNRMIRQLVFDETGMGSRFLVLVQAKGVSLPGEMQGLKRRFTL